MNFGLVVSLLGAAESSWDAHVVGHSDVQLSYVSDADEILMSPNIVQCKSYLTAEETRTW